MRKDLDILRRPCECVSVEVGNRLTYGSKLPAEVTIMDSDFNRRKRRDRDKGR